MIRVAKKEICMTQKQQGATLVEYAIMVALIAIVSIAVIQGLGQSVNTTFATANNYIGNATSAPSK